MKRVYLEISNACNLNCSFCTVKKGRDFMDLAVFEDYCLQIREFCDYIYLHMIGEPLLHPRFEEILKILDGQGFKLQLVSNGLLLSRYPDLLEHPCLRKLSLSLHSVNNTDIDTSYFETIDRLIENNEKIIELRLLKNTEYDEKINAYLDSLKKRFPFEKADRPASYRLKDKLYLKYLDEFRWPDLNDEPIGDVGTCHGAIDMIGINVHGLVSICCLDPEARNLIGDLKKQTLKEVLDSVQYRKYLDEFRQHVISSELCRRCSYRLRFR